MKHALQDRLKARAMSGIWTCKGVDLDGDPG